MEYDEALLSNYTVPELQQECKKRGLKKSGIKMKLIQRLTEHIEKYGPDVVLPPVNKSRKNTVTSTPSVEEPILDKSVNAIHNPHPYMAEYEEQLIEGANMEGDIDEYYDCKDERVVEPHLENPDKEFSNDHQTETYTNDEVPDTISNTPSPEIPKPASPIRRMDDEHGDHDNFRDARDISEELTEPIHNSSDTFVDRIVHLPENVEHENENNKDEYHNDENNDEEKDDAVLGEEPDETLNRDFDDDDDDDDDDNKGREDAEVVEEDTGITNHEDSSEINDETQQTMLEEDEDRSMEEVEHITEALHKEDDEDAMEEGAEILDYADADDDTEASEMQCTDLMEREEDHVEELCEDENDMQGDEEEEDMAEMDEAEVHEEEDKIEEVVNIEEEEDKEPQESEDEEEGEIMTNDSEEHCVGGGDDHLDVSILDDKIAEDSAEEAEEAEQPTGTPKPPKKTVVPVSLKKRVSLVASTETAEEKAARRKRRWGATNTLMKNSPVPISSESIKKLIPDMKIDAAALESVPELDYQEDDFVEETIEITQPPEDVDAPSGSPPPKVTKVGRTVKVDSAKKITLNKSTSQEVVTVESDSGEAPKPSPPAPAQSIRTYVVDDEVEIQEQREKSPSPARNPISQYIYIENLVRPYTINQLKSIIRRSGEICEGGFWINNIKSRCYVKLSADEQATATRDALHGLKWPAGSPKLLKVDYAVNQKMFTETEGLLGEKPKIVIEIEDKENDPIIIPERSQETRRERRESERSKSRGERNKRESKEGDKCKEKEKKDVVEEREESPAKLLDDLFRKTKATPCIYWLPLTEEQILEREKLEQSRASNQTDNTRYDAREMVHSSNDRYLDRRSQQYRRGANRAWR